MTIQHMSEVKAENARLREEGRKLVEANTKHFNTATENYKEAVRLREELAAAQAAVKKYSDLLRICRLSNLSQELDVAIDEAMKEVGHD